MYGNHTGLAENDTEERKTTYEVLRDVFRDLSTGETYRTIALGHHRDASEEWKDKQQAAIREYLTTQKAETVEDERRYLRNLFQAYISSTIIGNFDRTSIMLLDVGCGISQTIPGHIGVLAKKCTYVGLDPIDVNRQREYLFILGTLESLPEHLASRFDVFVFLSSLDHLENVPRAAEAIRQIAGRNAFAVFLVGLHDAQLMAEKVGREHYRSAFESMRFSSFTLRLIYNLIGMCKLYVWLMLRQRHLEKEIPLDGYHFHYFTTQNIKKYIEEFGDIVDLTLVPGTNVAFISCRLR